MTQIKNMAYWRAKNNPTTGDSPAKRKYHKEWDSGEKQDRKVRKAQKKLIKARELMAEGRAMTEGGGWIEQPTKSARRSWRTGTVGLPDYETIDTGVEPTKAFSGKTDTQTYGVGPKTEKKGQKKIKKARRKQTKAQKKLKKVNVDHTLEKEAEVFGK